MVCFNVPSERHGADTDGGAVVYFHDNHLPDSDSQKHGPFDLVNLETAISANEIWFNSHYHHRSFLERAAALVARHPELAAHDPMPAIFDKSHVIFAAFDAIPACKTIDRRLEQLMEPANELAANP